MARFTGMVALKKSCPENPIFENKQDHPGARKGSSRRLSKRCNSHHANHLCEPFPTGMAGGRGVAIRLRSRNTPRVILLRREKEITMRKQKLIFVVLSAALTTLALHADTITVNMGPSSEDFTLTGQGDVAGQGTYTVQQGACSTSAGITTCDLTGSIFGGSPGFNSGTFDFITRFASGDAPIGAVSDGPDPGPTANYFFYSSFPSDLSMVLDLSTPGGNYEVPLVTNAVFDGPGFSFGYTGIETCTGLGATPCSQAAVGLVEGSTISGPVNISVTFDSAQAVPEPSSIALLVTMILGAAFLGRKQIAQRL